MFNHPRRRSVVTMTGAMIAAVAGLSVTVAIASAAAPVTTTPAATASAITVDSASAVIATIATDPSAETPLAKDTTAELVVDGVAPGSTSVAYRVITLHLDASGTAPAAPPYVWAEPVRDFVRDYDAKHNVDFITDGVANDGNGGTADGADDETVEDAGDAGNDSRDSDTNGAANDGGTENDSGDTGGSAGVVGDAYAGLPSDDIGDPANATAGQIADFADQLARFVGGRTTESGLESYTAVTSDSRTGVQAGAGDAGADGSGSGGAQPGDGSQSDGNSDATATFTALPPGGYLVLTTGGGHIHRPVIANIAPRYDAQGKRWLVPSRVEAGAKSAVPTVDKSINEDRDDEHVTGEGVKGTGSDVVAVGDRVVFDLRADVPVFPNNAIHRDFTITDTLSTGLTPVSESIEVFGVGADGRETSLAADSYGLTFGGRSSTDDDAATGEDTVNGGAFTFRVDLGGARYDGIRTYRAIHVRYRAIVNAQVVVGPGGNPNDVRLEYSNNPYHDASHGTDDDRVTAYSYGLEVLKTGGDGKPLAGAVFALGGDVAARVADGSSDSADSPGSAGSPNDSEPSDNKPGAGVYEGVVPDGAGRYRLPRRDSDGGIMAEDRALLTRDLAVSADGELWISGLRPGDYTLTETKAPDGYAPLAEPITFSIVDAANSGGAGGRTAVEFTGEVVGQRTVGYGYGQVRNYRNGLPRTGAAGILVLCTAGAFMVLGGVAGLAASSRRRRR